MLDIEELKVMKISELNKIAQDMNITGFSGLKKAELIFRILEEQTAQEGLIFSKGVLEILPDGYGELISGSEREYDFKKIEKKLEKDRLDKKDYQLFLKLAKEGRLKPSAGAGLGIERFIAYICGVKHVADVQPFPRIPGIVTDL